MSWNKIASDLLIQNTPFDKWKLTIPENTAEINIPKIIKLTLKLLENAFSNGKNKIIIVYPEGFYLPSLTVVFQAISSISSGKIRADNDFLSFQPGQKMKYNNSICEFIEIQNINNTEMVCVKLSDGTICKYPKDRVPPFQKTDTKRPVSRDPSYMNISNKKFSLYDDLKSKRTFLKDNITYISSSRKFQRLMNKINFDNYNIEDILLLGKLNSDGKVNIINKGQLNGIPAILFSNDLYLLNTQILDNMRYLFVDYSDKVVNCQLDALDNLIRKHFPVVIISDYINSFNLENLENRGFLTLRWDKDSLIPIFDESLKDNVNQKIINCCNKRIVDIQCENTEISKISNILRNIRYYILNNTNQSIMDLYWQLYYIIILLLHKTIAMSLQSRNILLSDILAINNKLKTLGYNISPEIIDKLNNIIDMLKIILDEKYQFSKVKETENIILSSINNKIIIIPDNEDKNIYVSYWNNIFNKSDKNIAIMYAQEYSNRTLCTKADVIVCGWLGEKEMRNIIFCNNESEIFILLSSVELKWKKTHISKWEKISKNESRHEFDRYFTTIVSKPVINTEDNDNDHIDEIDNINNSIQKNRYRKYCSQNAGNDPIDAIPVTFVNGYFTFYKESSDVITVTDIINSFSEDSRAIIKAVNKIQVGDFIVIRETERSLIRELADNILGKEGKKEYREISSRWKNKLLEKCKVCSVRELHEKVKKEGSTIGLQAFRSWINNDDFIAPQDKDNLLYIAIALKDNYLINNIKKITEACAIVNAAHKKAGFEISNKLKKEVSKFLSKMPNLGMIDIWEPIELQLDELGKIKILKVILIGDPITVDSINTNRLLSESSREKNNT